MSVDTSTVQIVINVTDGNSGEVIAQLERSFSRVGAAGSMAGQKIAQGMDAGLAGMRRAGQSAEEMGGHFTTNLDKVRLFRQELGIWMPRALENMISRFPAAMSAIQGLTGVMVAFGAIGIISSLGVELYHFYERWLDVNGAVDDFNKKAAQAAAQKFYDTSSLEDLNSDLERTNRLVDQLNQKRSASGSGQFLGGITQYIPGPIRSIFGSGLGAGLNEFGQPYAPFTNGDKDQLNKSQALSDQDQLRKDEEDHRARLAQIRDQELKDAAKEIGSARIESVKNAAIKEAAENQAYLKQREADLAKTANRGKQPNDPDYVTVNPNAGDFEKSLALQHANAEAEAQTYQLNRQQTQQLMRLREEALEAGLRGNALYEAQEQAAIEQLKMTDMDSAAARNAIHEKFHNQEMARLREEQTQVAQRAREAGGYSLTGVAKAQYEGQTRDQQILSDVAAHRYHSLADAQKDRESNYKHTLAEIGQAEKSFQDYVQTLADTSAQHQISGYAQIRAEASKQLDALQERFKNIYGQTNPNSAEYQHGLQELNRGRSAIQSVAGQQTADLTRKNADETAQIEEEAYRKTLSVEQQRTQAIVDQYNDRLRAAEDAHNHQLLNDQEFAARQLAIQRDASAEMINLQREEQQRMAGVFSRFFENPLSALREAGTHAAGEFAARTYMRLARRGNGGTTATPGGWSETLGLPSFPGFPMPASHTSTAHAGPILQAQTAGSITIANANVAIGSAVLTMGNYGVGTSSPATVSGGAISLPGFGGMTLSSPTNGAANLPTMASSSAGIASTASGAAGMNRSTSSVMGSIQSGVQSISQLSSTLGIRLPGSGSSSGSSVPVLEPNDDTSGLPGVDGLPLPSSSSNASVLGGGGFMNNAAGLAGGGAGLISAYFSNGGIGTALSGMASGAQLGMAIGGPIGAAVGAAAGGVIGAIGFGGSDKARHWWDIYGKASMNNDMNAYQLGQSDYQSTYTALTNLLLSAKQTTAQWGHGGEDYFGSTIRPAIQDEMGTLSREERAGRSQFTMSAGEFHTGGGIAGFGTMATSADEGLIHARMGEFVVNPNAAASHRMALEAINAGASHATMADYYGAGRTSYQPASGGDRNLTMNVHAIDRRGVRDFLDEYKHDMRAALNDSYGEYSGGADATY